MDNPIPIQYLLKLYENSFINDPSGRVQSESLFPRYMVGEYVGPATEANWTDEPERGN